MSFDESVLENYQREFNDVCKAVQEQADVLKNSLGTKYSVLCFFLMLN